MSYEVREDVLRRLYTIDFENLSDIDVEFLATAPNPGEWCFFAAQRIRETRKHLAQLEILYSVFSARIDAEGRFDGLV